MKRKILLLLVMISFITVSQAQKSKSKSTQITGFAITGLEKGQTGWKEVRLVDITTGEELKSIYKSNQELEPLNARTGKPVVKKDITSSKTNSAKRVVNLDMELDRREIRESRELREPKEARVALKDNNAVSVEIDKVELEKTIRGHAIEVKPSVNVNTNVHVYTDVNTNVNTRTVLATKIDGFSYVEKIVSNDGKNIIMIRRGNYSSYDKPFATNSAACAYDKKHERLYYTPMGINQLRFIDLKSGKVYYFEDEAFGVVSGPGDAPNQITRMVLASDGDGYALSNNAEHLVRFTTGKNPTISDLGTLTDDAANGNYSVHNGGGYGGDMIADASKNLYLITANRNVFKISIETKVATYVGTIKGLPKGFTTNGAMVEEGGKVIVCSSQSTLGYFRFDLSTMQAEKVSTTESVYNASDLANGNLAFDKKKKKKDREPAVVKEEVTEQTIPEVTEVSKQSLPSDVRENNGIGVYPNPVTQGFVKVSFRDQPAGKYQVQLLDISGKLVSSQEVVINNKVQVEEFRLPQFVTAGSYLLKVSSEINKVSSVTKLTVQ